MLWKDANSFGWTVVNSILPKSCIMPCHSTLPIPVGLICFHWFPSWSSLDHAFPMVVNHWLLPQLSCHHTWRWPICSSNWQVIVHMHGWYWHAEVSLNNKPVVIVQLSSGVWLHPMDCSTPGFPVLHYFLEFAQVCIYWICDTNQPSHPLLPSSPSAFHLSQHQGLFQ